MGIKTKTTTTIVLQKQALRSQDFVATTEISDNTIRYFSTTWETRQPLQSIIKDL